MIIRLALTSLVAAAVWVATFSTASIAQAAEDSDSATTADASSDASADAPTYLLRYKFKNNESLRWKVVHQAMVRTTVSGTTQTAETYSESIKLWQFNKVDEAKGLAQFVHSVESVDMRQSVSGRQDVRYNSLADAAVPPEFEEVSKAVGVPLSTIVINALGNVEMRHEERVQPGANPGEMAIPMPEQAVAVGTTWSTPQEKNVRMQDGTTRPIKTRQQFTLKSVDNGIAAIRVETVVLTPIHDPALEAQLVQHITDGTIRFDIAGGRIVGQQIDVDKRIVGFQGETSSMHYLTRFTEELLSDSPKVAQGSGTKPSKSTAAGTAVVPGKEGAAPTAGGKTGGGAASATGKDNKATASKQATKPSNGGKTGAAAGNKTAAKPPAKQPPAKAKAKTGSKPTTTQQKRS